MSAQDLLQAVATNSQAVTRLSDQTARTLAEVKSDFQILNAKLQEAIANSDMGAVSQATAQITKNTATLETAIVDLGKISEIGVQTDPGTESPETPIPPTETTPINTDKIPPDVDVDDVVITESPANVGGTGTVNIDLPAVDDDESED